MFPITLSQILRIHQLFRQRSENKNYWFTKGKCINFLKNTFLGLPETVLRIFLFCVPCPYRTWTIVALHDFQSIVSLINVFSFLSYPSKSNFWQTGKHKRLRYEDRLKSSLANQDTLMECDLNVVYFSTYNPFAVSAYLPLVIGSHCAFSLFFTLPLAFTMTSEFQILQTRFLFHESPNCQTRLVDSTSIFLTIFL